MIIQVAVTLFVLLLLARLFQNFKERRISGVSFGVWFIVWVAVIVIFWSPDIASQLALRVGIGRGADLVIYISIIVILYLLYRLAARIEKMDRDITKIVRAIALSDDKKNEESSDPYRNL
jgi:hypothetical protein